MFDLIVVFWFIYDQKRTQSITNLSLANFKWLFMFYTNVFFSIIIITGNLFF